MVKAGLADLTDAEPSQRHQPHHPRRGVPECHAGEGPKTEGTGEIDCLYVSLEEIVPVPCVHEPK